MEDKHEGERAKHLAKQNVELVVDRIENGHAVLEFKRQTFAVPLSVLPEGLSEGDVLNVSFRIDREAGARRRKEIAELLEDVFKPEELREPKE